MEGMLRRELDGAGATLLNVTHGDAVLFDDIWQRPGLAPPVDSRRRATHRPAVALGRGRQQRSAARAAATADDWPGRAPYATISAFPVTA